MYAYGGFSQRCQDYCDDIWNFDIYMKAWQEIYNAGVLSHYYSIINNVIIPMANVPISNGSHPGPWAGPGQRWRFSMKTDGTMMVIFGGHRLWQGFSIENSQDNNWNLNNTRMPGGYLNDLWIYTKVIDTITRNGETFHTTDGTWAKMEPKYVCANSWDGVSWSQRFDVACTTSWPSAVRMSSFYFVVLTYI